MAKMTNHCCLRVTSFSQAVTPTFAVALHASATLRPVGEHTETLLTAGWGLSLPWLSRGNEVQQEAPPAPLMLCLIVTAAAQGCLIRTLTWLGRLYSSWIISVEGQMVFLSASWRRHLFFFFFFLHKVRNFHTGSSRLTSPGNQEGLSTSRSRGTQFIQIVEWTERHCLHE